MARRLVLAATVLTALVLILPAFTRAATYCVNAGSCAGVNEPDLQTALTAAQSSTAISDTVQVGDPGPGTAGYIYTDGGNSANEVNIVGAGTASTVLTRSGTGTVLSLNAPGSDVSHLTVQLPDADATGISTTGSVDDVNVSTLDSTGHGQTGMEFDGAGVTEHWSGGSIQLGGSSVGHVGLRTQNDGGVLTIQDATVDASGFGIESDLRNSVTMRRVAIIAPTGYEGIGATVSMDEVTFVAEAFPHVFIESLTNSGAQGDARLTLDHVSAFGNNVNGGVALELVSTVSGRTLTANVSNSIVHGFPNLLSRNASGGGVANVHLAFNETDLGATVQDNHVSGSGSTTDGGGNVSGDPLWVDAAAGNFALQPGSPAIDHGDPAGLAAGESTTDVLGAPRISGGRLDIGAVELQQPPPVPQPQPAAKDTTAPTFKTSKLPKKLTLKKLLAGITFTITPSEPSSIAASLLGSASSVKLAKSFNFTLAQRKLGLAAGQRRITLKVRKKLLGRSRRFSLQLKIVATDASGNARTVKRTIKVR